MMMTMPEDNARPSTRTLAEAFFKTTDALTFFSEKVVKPQLDGLLGKSERDLAIVGTYYRMYGWMRSLLAMNERAHFQGAASAARSLFELKLDIELLFADQNGMLVKRYHAFPNAEKFRSASMLVAFAESHRASSIDLDVTTHKRFVDQASHEIETILLDNWGMSVRKFEKRGLGHWSGMSVKNRARTVDSEQGTTSNEQLYLEAYPLLSWYIHSGSTGTAGMGEQAIEALYGWAHSISHESIIRATQLCGKEYRLDLAVNGFNELLEEARLTGARFLNEQKTTTNIPKP